MKMCKNLKKILIGILLASFDVPVGNLHEGSMFAISRVLSIPSSCS